MQIGHRLAAQEEAIKAIMNLDESWPQPEAGHVTKCMNAIRQNLTSTRRD